MSGVSAGSPRVRERAPGAGVELSTVSAEVTRVRMGCRLEEGECRWEECECRREE